MPIVGYARVSTRDQDLTAQLDALKAADAETTYREKVSGVRADRPQLAKLMAKLAPGDVVIVTKLDRLGRSTRELLDLIERDITKLDELMKEHGWATDRKIRLKLSLGIVGAF